MDTGIRDFCVKYNEKLKNDKDIAENEKELYLDNRARISFKLNMSSISSRGIRVIGDSGNNLFVLDAEDLEYLHKKYSKKIEAEMEENIARVKDSYKDAL